MYKLIITLLVLSTPLTSAKTLGDIDVKSPIQTKPQKNDLWKSTSDNKEQPPAKPKKPLPDGVKKLQDYLNKLTTISADFVQTSPQGNLAGGKFKLSRPGKFKWQYNPPVPVLIMANYGEIVYYDKELDEITYINQNDTVASILSKKVIDLSAEDIEIKKYKQHKNNIELALNNPQKPDEVLNLIFSKNPIILQKMEITNSSNETTSIHFNNMQFGKPIADKEFIFKNPRMFGRNANN